MAHVAVS